MAPKLSLATEAVDGASTADPQATFRAGGPQPQIASDPLAPPNRSKALTASKSEHLFRYRGPEELFVRMTVLHLSNINEVDQTFTVKLRIHAKWICPAADKEDAKKRVDSVDLEWSPTWRPIFSVGRSVGRDSISSVYFSQKVDDSEGDGGAERSAVDAAKFASVVDGGEVPAAGADDDNAQYWVWSRDVMEVTVQDTVDLRAFPFDMQDYSIALYCENAQVMKLLVDGNSPAVTYDADGLTMPNQHVLSEPRLPAIYRLIEGTPAEPKAGEPEPTPAELRVVLFYERNVYVFLVDFYLLLFLIVSCVFGAWAIHFRDVSSRLGFDVTLLLVAVSFKQYAGGLSPPVNYLTLLDQYSLWVTIYLLLTVLVHTIIGQLTFDCDTITGDCFPRSGMMDGSSPHGFGWYHTLLDDLMASYMSVSTGVMANATHDQMSSDSTVVADFMESMMLFDRICLVAFLFLWFAGHIFYWYRAWSYSSSLKGKITTEGVRQYGYRKAVCIKRRYHWNDPEHFAKVGKEKKALFDA